MKRRLQFTMRQGMFVFWALASLLWVIFSGYMFHFGRVVDTYRAYSHYENMIMRGGASDYNRRAYRRAAQDMDELNRDVMLFLLVGFGMPGLVLSLGTWLIRKK